MGIHDRDYEREAPRRGPGSIRFFSVTTWLIIINAAVMVVGLFLPRSATMFTFPTDAIYDYGHFSTFKVTWQGGLEFWRFITFQFVHAGLIHLAMNMFGLYMFGTMVEEHLGAKRYLAFYLVCGIAGGFMYLLLNALGILVVDTLHGPAIHGLLIHDSRTPLVGASAGVFGVIMACAYIAPHEIVQLVFPPVELKMRTLAYGYVFIAILQLILGAQNAGGEAAHIGGAAAGFFFIRNSHLLRDFFDVFSDSRKPRKPRGASGVTGARAAEVDRILAKVREQGTHSLTDAEKATLTEETEARRRGA